MSNVINTNPASSLVLKQTVNDDISFNELVLEHIKKNRPDGSLNDLLNEMKGLSPDKPQSLSKLTFALHYSDSVLRQDHDYIDYTNDILDKQACQLLNLNMITNDMLHKTLFPDEKEPIF